MRYLMVLAMGCVGVAQISAPAAQAGSREDCARRGANPDLIIQACTEIIRSNPRDAFAYLHRGSALGRKGDYDRSIADSSEAIRLDPSIALAYMNRGVAYGIRGDYDRSFMDLNEAIRINPGFLPAYRNRAATWDAKGERAKAIRDYKKVLTLPAKDQSERDDQAEARRQLATLAAAPPAVPQAPALRPAPAPVALAPAGPAPQSAFHPPLGRRVALVIGNAGYKVGPLENPGNDAAAVAEVLGRDLEFNKVVIRRDLSLDGFRMALRDFSREAAGADLGMIYFAGHGSEVGGRNYLIPVDAALAKASDLELEAVALDAVLSQLDAVRKLRLIVLDACRNNPFPLAGQKRTASRGFSRIEPEDNTLVVYAAKHGTTADDGTGKRHSPFTEALLRHVTKPGIEVRQLFGFVRDDVMAVTGRAQQPYIYGTLGGLPLYLHVRP